MCEVEVTVLMPCLNEAKTIGICVEKAIKTLNALGVEGEVLVADNGSTDGSQALAAEKGARIVAVERRGYGAALAGGIEAAQGKYVIMGDADDSYNFTELEPFIAKLREGYELVMGNRFQGGIKQGAMPVLHRYLGNPGLSFIGRLFFGAKVRDFYCGLRGFNKESIANLNLLSTGMEFALEMVVKSHIRKLKITQVPTTLSPDGRDHAPHLRTWRDGWRSLRFFLIYSPKWLFFYPGIALMLISIITGTVLILGNISRTNSLLLSMTLLLLGMQSVFFSVQSRTFATQEGFLPPSKNLESFFRAFSLEIGLTVGALLSAAGIAGYVLAILIWAKNDFGGFPITTTRVLVIPSSGALILGFQIILNSFMLSILRLEHFGDKAKKSKT